MRNIIFLVLAAIVVVKLVDAIMPPKITTHVADHYDVVLYSAVWCGACTMAKRYFADNNIKYINYDVDTSKRGREDYARYFGKGIPVIVVNNEVAITGFRQHDIDIALHRQ